MARAPDPQLHDRLLRAARRVFAERGYGAASLDAIAAEAGVTKGGVYFHFASKEELFFAALDQARLGLRAAVRSPAVPVATGADELVTAVAAWLDFQFQDPDAARLFAICGGEVAGRPTAQLRADAREDLRGLRARLREILVRGGGDGTLDVRDPALTAFLLAAGVHGVAAQWLAAAPDVESFGSPASIADALVEPLRTGVSPTASGGSSGWIPRRDLSPSGGIADDRQRGTD